MKKFHSLILSSLLLLTASCSVIKDFANPSDLSLSVTEEKGIRIQSVSLSKQSIKNTGKDSCRLTCAIDSKVPVSRVQVNIGNLGGGLLSLVNDAKDKASWYADITSTGGAGSQSMEVLAENTLGYQATNSFNITICSISPYYVATNGSDTNDGSMSNPFFTIQKAIDTAAIDGIGSVYVSAGLYTNNNLFSCITLADGVSVYGGYPAGFNGPSDPSINKTVIDGLNLVTHIVYAKNIIMASTTLDGFVLKRGYAFGLFAEDNNGAGIYLEDCNLQIRNCEIISNTANNLGAGIYGSSYHGLIYNNIISYDSNAGGIFLYLSSGDISNNQVINNISQRNGGGIALYSCSKMNISGSVLSNLSSNKGGGIYIDKGYNISILASVTGNYAGDGGAGLFLNNCLNVTYNSNIITNNNPDQITNN